MTQTRRGFAARLAALFAAPFAKKVADALPDEPATGGTLTITTDAGELLATMQFDEPNFGGPEAFVPMSDGSRMPPSPFESRCPFVFGGPECRYPVGRLKSCDKTFETCVMFGNERRFGGVL